MNDSKRYAESKNKLTVFGWLIKCDNSDEDDLEAVFRICDMGKTRDIKVFLGCLYDWDEADKELIIGEMYVLRLIYSQTVLCHAHYRIEEEYDIDDYRLFNEKTDLLDGKLIKKNKKRKTATDGFDDEIPF